MWTLGPAGQGDAAGPRGAGENLGQGTWGGHCSMQTLCGLMASVSDEAGNPGFYEQSIFQMSVPLQK